MENKSNSLNRIKPHQREKVLRFSIRKYSFGAASVAVAALMFLGARVASADSVIENHSQPTTDVVNQKEKDKPLAEIQQPTDIKVEVAQNPSEKKMTTNNKSVVKVVDKAKLKKVVEELKTTLSSKSDLDKSVISPIKDRVQKGQALLDSDTATQKDVDELLSLLESDLTVLSNATKESSKVRESNTGTEAEKPASQSSSEVRASEENQTVSAKKDSLKVSVDQLQAAISEVPEHDTTKEVLKKANEVMVLAQDVLQNTTVSLTDVEQMNKLVKRMFTSVKNATTRLGSGSHHPRNGQRIAEGTGFRADGVRVEGALDNVKEYISEDKFSGGGTDIGQRARTIDKTFMTAKYSTEGNKKFITYDVYFQNDGMALSGLTGNAFWFYPPRDILYNSGNYVRDTIVEAYYERYRKNAGATGRLSDNPDNFTKLDTYNAIEQVRRNGTNQDDSSRRQWGDRISLYQLDGGPTRDNQTQQMLKQLQHNAELNKIIRLNNNPRGSYPGLSYSQLLTISSGQNYAYKYHVKMRLKDNVTPEQAQNAGTIAVTAKEGKAYNALQAYVYAATGTRLESRLDAQLYPIKGKEVTKTVGASLGDVSNPVASDLVVRNDDSKNFPGGMRWNWTNGQPNTSAAGIFKYNVTATYSDNSSNSTTATLKVKPKTPVIDQSSVNEKAGKTGQTVTVNVGNGVPTGSTVTLYSGTKVIGTGNTTGLTATIRVSGALPSTAITAKTTVTNNYGTVESELSAPAIPTEVPDRVAPTVLINGNRLTANADDNRFIIYRGANFNPTFRVQDDKNNVTLSITDLPKGVANVSTNGSKDLSYTIPGNTVATDAPFGESTATVVASDGRNRATYRFKYRIVDIQAKNSTTENRALGSALGNPHDHFKVAESNTVENDKYYPDNMRFVWKELNTRTFQITDVPNNTKLNEIGTITKYIATAVFPNTVNSKTIDRVNYTIYTPTQKPVQMTFNVTDNVKPTVKLVADNGSDTTLSESTAINALPKVTVYRGENATVTVKASDNTGKVQNLTITNLPTGLTPDNSNRTSDNATDSAPLTKATTGKVDKTATVEAKVATVTVSDKSNPANTTTVQFKVDVKAQNEKYTPTAGTTPVAVNNIGSISNSDLEKIKNSVTVPNLSQEATRDGITKTLKDSGRVTVKNGKKYVTVEVTYPDRSKDEVSVEVQQNTNVQKQPTIYVVKGETISNEELRKFVYLPNGAQKEELPSTATVAASLDTASRGSKTTNVTVTFQGSNPVVVPVTYEVIQNFPVANKVYDFAGVSRGNGASDYYVNQGLRQGMSWFVEKETVEGGRKVFKKVSSDNNMNSQIASDITAGVGEYRYKLGARFREGRFTNQAEEAARLSYSGEIVHTVYDVVANTTKVEATYGSTLTNTQAQSAVMKATNSQNLPAGTTYEWVANASGAATTNLTVSTYGEETRYVKVTLPKTREAGSDSAAATQVNPYKVIEVKVKVNETVKPTVKLVSDNRDVTLSESTVTNALPKVTVYRGENATVTVKASDNTGKVQNLTITNLPTGLTPDTNNRTSDNATDVAPLTKATTGKVDKTATVEAKVATVTVSDKSNPANTTTVQFKVDVKAQNEKYTPTAGTTPVAVNNIGSISNSDLEKIKNSVTVPNLSQEATRDGITKTLKDSGRVTVKNGKKYVTVEVTYPDRSKDEVDVAVEEVLKAGEKNPTNKAVDGQPYISNEKVINPNKEDATFTATPTNGLTVGTEGKVTGIPTGITWTGNETEKIVKIPVTVTRTGETPVNVEISVVVQRDVTKTPTFTVGTQDPTTGNVDVTVTGVPNGTKVKLPGVKGEKVVTDGKVTLPNDELPETPQTGKGSAQEEGKLPKEGTSDITIPKKLVESGTPTFTVGTQDPTTGNVDVTVTGVPNGTKVKLPGVKGEKVVTDGKVTLPNDELPETPQTGKGSAQEEGKLPKEGTSDITIPGKISSSKGEPEVQTETPDYTNPISSNGVDGNGNLIDPPTVELPEFNGGVNGELPEPITLPELTIEVRWIDEDGNVLKPSVKTGNEKNAEHGTIPGYEFVRTMIDENESVMTHIFRKVGSNTNTIPVTPVKPDTNGGSGQDTPAPATPTPNAVTPNADQIDTKTTVDNGAKSNDSQNVLPNTGTESNATLASLGLLGLLSGFGLVARKKKED